MNPIQVMIVDDHTLFRDCLRLALAREGDIEVIGEASNGFKAVNAVESLKPDVLLLDIKMPEMDGLQALNLIKERCPSTRVLMLSGYFKEDFVLQALQAGAKGYVLKEVKLHDLVKAIRTVSDGEVWIERKLTSKLLDEFSRISRREKRLSKNKEALTKREVQVALLIADGLSNKEIANRLFISERTVKTHLHNIFKKLKASQRIHVALHTLRHHLPKK